MAVDQTDHWLATGDVDGVVKVWDIMDYCITDTDQLVTYLPRFVVQVQLHVDMINTLAICTRNEHLLVISTSVDCSVQLYDVTTKSIVGTFGQEARWRIDPVVFNEDVGGLQNDEEKPGDVLSRMSTEIGWEPDGRAVADPAHYRINSWAITSLGKEYQELRVSKRERRQPYTIPDLPYLQWDKLKLPPAGPHNALDTSELKEIRRLEKPDFIHNPHKYFSERLPPIDKGSESVLADSLHAAFDEKSIFPKYILDFEAKLRQTQDRTDRNQPSKNTQYHVGARKLKQVKHSMAPSVQSGSVGD
jgi:WD40 repeat protein